jgi:hypothetical protein
MSGRSISGRSVTKTYRLATFGCEHSGIGHYAYFGDMTFDLQVTGQALLNWLYDHGAPNEFTPLEGFLRANGLPDEAALPVANDLKNQGLVNVVFALGGSADSMLTPAGIRYVQDLRRQRDDPVARMTTLRDRMLLWLFAQGRRSDPPQDWTPFLSSESAQFLGGKFSKSEMDREVEYLRDRGLITTDTRINEELNGWFYPRLTADGLDCITIYGGSVSEFLRSRNSGANYHFSQNTGAISVNSSNVAQSVTHGVDTSALLQFAQAMAQMLPVLEGVPEDDKAELRETAIAVEAEIAQPQPNIGRLRQLYSALWAGLSKATSSAGADILIALGHEASKALGIGS